MRSWPRLDDAARRLRDLFEAEAERGRFALWVPVLIGAGALLYLGVPFEPPAWTLAAAACLLAIVAFVVRRRPVAGMAALAVLLVALGACAGKWRVERVAAPQLHLELGPREVDGVIERAEWRENGIRFVVRAEAIERLQPETAPERLLVTWRGAEALPPVGSRISALVLLWPAAGPTAPGAYHWRRALFFQGIGATGIVIGEPGLTAPEGGSFAAGLANLRAGITGRILSAIDGEPGGVAAALITGERGRISEETDEALRRAGLYHILSISGTHMALVAGAMFLAVRFFLAAIPGLALRRPIRKWAAFAALMVGAFYLAISGGQIATQRSFIMIAIMLGAIMVDRHALTMRNVALAALLLLLLFPESVLSASFQMSFAATVALIAAYEAGASRLRPREERGRFTPLRSVAGYAAMLALSSVVAGAATAPFAVYHFHMATPYGLAGNLMAMPLVAFVVMPMGLLATIVMPLGLEALPLYLMGLGIEGVLATSHWVASWPGALVPVPRIVPWALVAGTFGGLWLCLWRTRVRLAGAVMMLAVAALAAGSVPRADLIVSDDGRTVAIRQADGRLGMFGPSRARFAPSRWLEAEADPRLPAEALAEGSRCDPRGCIAETGAGRRVALVLHAAAFEEDCRFADILVTPLSAPASCDAPVLIDADALLRGGAHAVTWEQGTAEAVVDAALNAGRPWDAPPFWLTNRAGEGG